MTMTEAPLHLGDATPGPRPLALVVDDETGMRKLLCLTLAGRGYRVVEAAAGHEALRQAAAHVPDVVLLDFRLPDIDGLEVTRRLREWTSMPIIVVSACGHEQQKVAALDAGADDYVTKPVTAGELLARVRAALRRDARAAHGPPSTVITALRMDLARRLVFVGDAEVRLTPIEYRLLAELVKHAGMVVTQKQLLERVWGPRHAHDAQYLRVYVSHLRRKLEKDPGYPAYLVTEAGVGYRIKQEA